MFKKPQVNFVCKEKYYAENSTEYIEPALKALPQEFKDIKPWFGFNLNERIKNIFKHDSNEMPKTIKQCNGIMKLWRNCFLLKFPADVILDISTEEERWQATTADPQFITVVNHSQDQMGKMLPDRLVIKFLFEMYLETNTEILPLSAIYHKPQPFEILPGIIYQKHKSPPHFNIIVTIPKITKSYIFKKGEPLCLLYTKAPAKFTTSHNPEVRLVKPEY